MNHENHHKRYIENNFDINEVNEVKLLSQINTKFEKLMNEQIKYCPFDQDKKILSTGKQKEDCSIYTGTGGNVYIYLQYYLLKKSYNSEDLENVLDDLQESFDINLQIAESNDPEFYNNPSFFHSPAGIYTLGCLIAKEIKNLNLFFDCLSKLLLYKKFALNENLDDEILYGGAGYLYCLLLVKENCQNSFEFNIDLDIIAVTNHLFEEGYTNMKLYSTNFLIYPFPKTHKKFYIGGAHGVIGVLYLILSALTLVPNNDNLYNSSMNQIISSSLNELSKLQFESGNFPSSLNNETDELVHFCHGATGAVYLYCLAYNYFKQEEYLKIALKAGETIWKRGLLKKGNGICHGITGSAYSLHKLFMTTKDKIWKLRFLCFLNALYDEDINKICSHNVDKSRKIIGKADTPYSLMEGQGGLIVLSSEILKGDDYVLFPGYQVSNKV